MRYLGGKSKIRKQVASFLESIRQPNQDYLEPFVGAGWILQEVSGRRVASDANVALIALYKSLQDGWIPPEYVSEDEYQAVKLRMNMDDPLTAFCGFGCSFGGKWFGGYADHGHRRYSTETHRNLLKQLPKIKDVYFLSGTYSQFEPTGMLVYCDPPYEGTTTYGATEAFNHEEFWQTTRRWSEKNTVVISEYNAPDDFRCVKMFQSQMGLSVGEKSNRPKREEKLFMCESYWKKS